MMTEDFKPLTQRCVFHCATYTDVGMALNLNHLIGLAPHYGTIVFKKRFYSKRSMLFRPMMHDD
jgi:hypothetical protein